MAARKKAVPPERALAEACRAGSWKEALAELTTLSNEGNAAASAMVAQVSAALGRWDDVVTHGARFLATPEVARTGNVFSEVTRLVRRALLDELQTPAKLRGIAASIPPRWHAMRDATLLKDPLAEREPEARKASEQAVAAAPSMPRFRSKPEGLPAHLFALAVAFHVDSEIIARWSDEAAWGSFDRALDVARALVRAGKKDRAWKTLVRWLDDWQPVDDLQVLPVELLVDRDLREAVNAKRARALLDRGRAPR
ncbi:MAG: hypothetical protein ACOZQL_40350 [Myxococcota bacterium]